jgi:ATP-binding cassette subfamily C (CFTR/MRP) protein 1
MEAIFRKTLLIRVETAKEMGAAKASNLTSVGVKNIVTNVSALHEVWTVVLMTGIGLYIIWTQIGLSFLASVGRAVVFVSLLPLLSKDIGAARTHWADSTDRRVKFISSVLRHIKAIKMSAYESYVTVKAVDMRETEVVALITWIMQILKVSIATNWLNNFLALVTVATFTVVSIFSQNGGGAVTTARIFTVISTILLISMPLLMLGQQRSRPRTHCMSPRMSRGKSRVRCRRLIAKQRPKRRAKLAGPLISSTSAGWVMYQPFSGSPLSS